MGLTNWMPDFKGALASFYDEKIKPTLDSKSAEYKTLLKENFVRGANTQWAIVVILLAVFALLALAFFWKDNEQGLQWKYLLFGALFSYVTLYVLALKPYEFTEKLIK